jgi:hypothetical protein
MKVIGDGASLCILAGLFILIFVAVGSKNGVFIYVLAHEAFPCLGFIS